MNAQSRGSTASSLTVEPALLKDIYPGASCAELWRSDGAAAGTVLLKDIRSGADSSLPQELINVNGTLFFRANDGSVGDESWKSEGTEAGTVLVKDIRPGDEDWLPGEMAKVEVNSRESLVRRALSAWRRISV